MSATTWPRNAKPEHGAWVIKMPRFVPFEFEFTAEAGDRAFEQTRTFLKKIDVGKLDALRTELGLRPEQLGVVVNMYVDALVIDAQMAALQNQPHQASLTREVIPLSYPEPIRPGQVVRIKGTAKRCGFYPDRIFISSAGDPLGAAAFNLLDIQIDGKTQFAQEGEIPGDMFASGAIGGGVAFDTALPKGGEFALVVKYIGKNPDGASFYGSVFGSATGPIEEELDVPSSGEA